MEALRRLPVPVPAAAAAGAPAEAKAPAKAAQAKTPTPAATGRRKARTVAVADAGEPLARLAATNTAKTGAQNAAQATSRVRRRRPVAASA